MTLDGVFSFLDTFEAKSLKIKVSKHEKEVEKTKLKEELTKVWIYSLICNGTKS